MWNPILAQLRFIHNWVIMGIQWMVHWWVLVHYDLWQHHACEKPLKWTFYDFVKLVRWIQLSLNMSLSSNTFLAGLSQFFSILNDLKAPSQALQIIFEMQSPKERRKRTVKKISLFSNCKTHLFIFSFWPLLLH